MLLDISPSFTFTTTLGDEQTFQYFFLYAHVKDYKGGFPVASDRRTILNKIENVVASKSTKGRSKGRSALR